MAIEKMKILGDVLEVPAKLFSPFWPISLANGLDWQCCSAGSSKMAPRSLVLLFAMDADSSFELNTIEPHIFGHINLFLVSVYSS